MWEEEGMNDHARVFIFSKDLNGYLGHIYIDINYIFLSSELLLF